MTTGIERAREIQAWQEDFAKVHHLPKLTDLEIVKRALPLATELPLEYNQEGKETVLQQRVDCFFLLRYGRLLEEDLNDIVTEEDKLALVNEAAVNDESVGLCEDISTESQMTNRVTEFWESTSSLRTQFRQALQLILDDRDTAREKLAPFLSAAKQEMLVVPKFSWPDSAPIELVYCPLSDEGVLGYVLMVLLGDNDVSKRLRKCRFGLCEDFFITDGANDGGPKFVYCNDEHRLMARRFKKAEAERRYRKKRAKLSAKAAVGSKRKDGKK